MSKVICDICGTTYPDTADQCPICGCSREMGGMSLGEINPADLEDAVAAGAAAAAPKPGLFSQNKSGNRMQNTFVFDSDDDDEYEDEEEFDEDYDSDDEDDDEDDASGSSSAVLIALLVIVIAALLVVTGLIFFRYFVPNNLSDLEESTGVPTTEATVEATDESTEPTIPCEKLALTGGSPQLNEAGQYWLLNVVTIPADTTDVLTYSSADETVATVSSEGRITAVGEGETVIYITCGSVTLECKVLVDYSLVLTEPTEETEPTETNPEETDPEETEQTEPTETEPEETTEPTEPLKDIVLKVSLTDITFNAPNQGYTFKVEGLTNREVSWTSMDEKVVTVDENGFVTSIGEGTTTIIAQYGDQKVEIKIRCDWA